MHPQSKPSFKKRFGRALLILAALYFLLCFGCASFQRRLIYFPTACASEKVDRLALSAKLERWRGPQGGQLGWKRLSLRQPAQGQVLVMHGNACSAFECGHYADVLQQVAPFDLFFVEYPGYADCSGSPSEHSLEKSACQAFEALPKTSPIYLVGESLGTGVAAYLAGHFSNQVSGIVLFAPYNQLADVAQAHFRILPVRLLLCDRFPAEDYMRSYHGPLAVLVGGQDTVVPERFGRRLYDGYAGPKRLWRFPEATHDTLMVQPDKTWQQIIEFWNSAAAVKMATVR